MNKMYDFKTLLGQGSFSTDPKSHKKVAFKMEKPDKSKRVLMFEYQVLLKLQGLPHICKVYDFVESDKISGLNCIVMQLMGKNLANLKKAKGKEFTPYYSISLLLQIIDAIESVHDKGYIHRDIKPSNFVTGKGKMKNNIYMIDFGLSKLHLNPDGTPTEKREKADFRGTVTYASLNAHNKIDLARRDDLWSFYFMMLDFLGEPLPWRGNKDNKMDDVRDIKTKCFQNPEKFLWKTVTKDIQEKLEYEDRPDYEYIRKQLISLQTQLSKVKPEPSLCKIPHSRKRACITRNSTAIKAKKVEFSPKCTPLKADEKQENNQYDADLNHAPQAIPQTNPNNKPRALYESQVLYRNAPFYYYPPPLAYPKLPYYQSPQYDGYTEYDQNVYQNQCMFSQYNINNIFLPPTGGYYYGFGDYQMCNPAMQYYQESKEECPKDVPKEQKVEVEVANKLS